jgi:hypothetical protein
MTIPSDENKPKYKPSWFKWNWDDFIAETDHLAHVAHSAATRIMGALWRTKDCTLPDDPKILTRGVRERQNGTMNSSRNLTALLR